jgi:hypothetical protein
MEGARADGTCHADGARLGDPVDIGLAALCRVVGVGYVTGTIIGSTAARGSVWPMPIANDCRDREIVPRDSGARNDDLIAVFLPNPLPRVRGADYHMAGMITLICAGTSIMPGQFRCLNVDGETRRAGHQSIEGADDRRVRHDDATPRGYDARRRRAEAAYVMLCEEVHIQKNLERGRKHGPEARCSGTDGRDRWREADVGEADVDAAHL